MRPARCHTHGDNDRLLDGLTCRHSLKGWEVQMVGALLLGFVVGVIARVLMPNDVFRNMSGPKSWLVSLVVGLLGALVGYFLFTVLLGIGDTDIFDWGGFVGALIGTLIVLPIAAWILRRTGSKSSA
jgi:uncharacterized membrane protein YeaQ/YmgE (transglycosylase-associated protein family)